MRPPASARLRTLRTALVTFALLGGGLIGVTAVWALKEDERDGALRRLRAEQVVRTAADLVTRSVELVEQDARFLADAVPAELVAQLDGGPLTVPAGGSGLAPAEVAGTTRLEALWGSFLTRRQDTYLHVALLDAAGREVVRVDDVRGTAEVVPRQELQDKGARYYHRALLELDPEAAYLSPLDLNIERGAVQVPLQPTFRAAVPVHDESGRRVGGLVLNHRAAGLLERLDDLAAQAPGDLLVVDADGRYVAGGDPARRWGLLLGRPDASLGQDDPALWSRIREGGEAGASPWAWVGLGGTSQRRPLATPGAATPPSFDLWIVCRMPEVAPLPERLAEAAARTAPYTVPTSVALALLIWSLAATRARERQGQEVVARSELRLRRLSRALLDAEERERRALARDLHDELGQLGTVAALQLRRARSLTDPEQRDRALATTEEAVDEIMVGMRRIAERLRPELLDDLGLVDAVRELVASFERRTGVSTRLVVERSEGASGGGRRGEDLAGSHLFRILQAALANVARHAEAGEVVVHLVDRAGVLQLSVRDDGRGFDPADIGDGRLGLLGMRERAELFGGSFEIRTAPGQGTEVRVRLGGAPAPPDPVGSGVSDGDTEEAV